METFLFYLTAMLVAATAIAAVADMLGWLYPGWDPGDQGGTEDPPELEIGERSSEPA